jgi:hypothetical protein
MPSDDLWRAGHFQGITRLDRLRDDTKDGKTRAGQTTKPVFMPLDMVKRALRRSVLVAAGLDPVRTPDPIPPVLWDDGTNRLLVHLAEAEVSSGASTIDVTIGVECDEIGHDRVVCTFVTSSVDRPAGFMWATESRPRGPAAVVEIWGEALVAVCWRTLVEVAGQGAAAQGNDALGQPLVASTVVATADGLAIVPMAAPRFMRIAGTPT